MVIFYAENRPDLVSTLFAVLKILNIDSWLGIRPVWPVQTDINTQVISVPPVYTRPYTPHRIYITNVIVNLSVRIVFFKI